MKSFRSVQHSNRRPRSARRRGQALIEFALVVVIFLTLATGMLQFGIYLSATNALWNLSREGARVASVQKPGTANGNQLIIDAIYNRTPPNLDTKKMVIRIEPDQSSARTTGVPVKVILTYDMRDKLFLPIGNKLAKNYQTTTSMMVE